jgi:hypothetical protein
MTKPVAQPARQELLALAARTRDDLDPDVLGGVLTDLTTQGVLWPRLMVETVRMLAQGLDVRDLRAALADPTKTRST